MEINYSYCGSSASKMFKASCRVIFLSRSTLESVVDKSLILSFPIEGAVGDFGVDNRERKLDDDMIGDDVVLAFKEWLGDETTGVVPAVKCDIN